MQSAITKITQSKLTADFDRIAELDKSKWDNNTQFHQFILNKLPQIIDKSLDIGCGKGLFTGLLAKCSAEVTGIDISPKMIHCALKELDEYNNVKLITGDISSMDLPKNYYDAIVSIAAMHHMDIDTVLLKIIAALKQNGTLVIVDLYRQANIVDFIFTLLSMPYAFILRIVNEKKLFDSKRVRNAWSEHCKDDKYMSIAEIKSAAEKFMPGAEVKRHLLWRYSLTWVKTIQ